MWESASIDMTPWFSAQAKLTTSIRSAGAESCSPVSGSIPNLDRPAWIAFHHAPRELRREVFKVVNDLAAPGSRVLDTRPNHTTLRHRPGKPRLCHGTRRMYALVEL